MRLLIVWSVFVATSVVPAAAHAQANAPDGAAVFTRACAGCHKPGQADVPAPEVLRTLTPESIINSLTNGKMSVQGSSLTAAERAAVAQYLTGRAAAASTTAASTANRCTARTPTTDPARAPGWMGWGNDVTNARNASQAGFTATDLPKLTLKWSFAYQGATSARVQPALAGGKLFAASDNGELHALDPKTGCTYWTFKAESGVRSALTVGPYKANGRSGYAVFFGDQRANAYAIDTVTGQQIWKRKVDEHQAAAITGAISIQDGKAFVAVQGLNEEGTGGRGQLPCCTFRGNLNALDANTGAFLWKTYTVDEPKLRGKNTRSGQDAFGPAGGGIWSSPTVDVKRRGVRLYRQCLRRSAAGDDRCGDRDEHRHRQGAVGVPGDAKRQLARWLRCQGRRQSGLSRDARSRPRLLRAASSHYGEWTSADRDSTEVGNGLRARPGQAGLRRLADAHRSG